MKLNKAGLQRLRKIIKHGKIVIAKIEKQRRKK